MLRMNGYNVCKVRFYHKTSEQEFSVKGATECLNQIENKANSVEDENRLPQNANEIVMGRNVRN